MNALALPDGECQQHAICEPRPDSSTGSDEDFFGRATVRPHGLYCPRKTALPRGSHCRSTIAVARGQERCGNTKDRRGEADRKSVEAGKSVSVRVDLGGRSIHKKKKNNKSKR